MHKPEKYITPIEKTHKKAREKNSSAKKQRWPTEWCLPGCSSYKNSREQKMWEGKVACKMG